MHVLLISGIKGKSKEDALRVLKMSTRPAPKFTRQGDMR